MTEGKEPKLAKLWRDVQTYCNQRASRSNPMHTELPISGGGGRKSKQYRVDSTTGIKETRIQEWGVSRQV